YEHLARSLMAQGYAFEAMRLSSEITALAARVGETRHRLVAARLAFDLTKNKYDGAAAAGDGAGQSEFARQLLAEAQVVLDLAERQVGEAPGPDAQDQLANAHFSFSQACMRNEQFDAAIDHLLADLRIKAQIKKLSGMIAGLFNLASV